MFVWGCILLVSPHHLSWAFSQQRSTGSSSAAATTTLASGNTPRAKDCLYDMPVSNNGARCRILIYKKQLQDHIDVVPPMELGGLRSDDYLQVNPQGKMPAFVDATTTVMESTSSSACGNNLPLSESDTIARYILTKYSDRGPSFQLDNPKSNLMARYHDMYLTTIQGCMYKAVGPFGAFASRKDALQEYMRQWNILADSMGDDEGPYLCGSEVSLADATIFPSAVFAVHMLPKFDLTPALPPKMQAWFDRLKTQDTAFAQVYNEIQGALEKWDANGRWDTILGAGLRDTADPTLFDKIVAGSIPATIVKEDDKVLAFRDINPAAPVHVLVIPKDRNGLTRLTKSSPEHVDILGRLLVAAGEIARDESLGFGDGARIVINDGPDGGQEIYHLHVHVLGGRRMKSLSDY
eukprot:scaffold1270_cov252-Amphora_coffeaeformis.AAC.4